jgi:hypothetical protein
MNTVGIYRSCVLGEAQAALARLSMTNVCGGGAKSKGRSGFPKRPWPNIAVRARISASRTGSSLTYCFHFYFSVEKNL